MNHASTKQFSISGSCDPHFQTVADTFEENFRSRNELGASLCVSIAGETVIDLWGGHIEQGFDARWQEDTLVVVFSCAKAATAICAHLLVDRGRLELSDPVARHWPEFAAAGKEQVTVEMLLNHTAGLPALREPVKKGASYDWDYMAARFADEAPFWPPGSTNGYHMTSFGWLVGELVRRVSGLSIGEFFKREVADPLGLDFWIGLPEKLEARVAPIELFKPGPDTVPNDYARALMQDASSIQYLSLFNNGGSNPNNPLMHRAELAGHGGISNARALAAMFTPLANDTGFLSSQRIRAMSKVSAETGRDENLLIPTRFGQGFMLRMDNRESHPGEGNSLLIGENAFGHVGLGGSVGFADPDHRLAVGYAMNRHGSGILMNDRGQALVDAIYASLQGR